MFLKKTAILFLCLACAGSLAFAGGGGQQGGSGGAKTVLNFWSWRTEDVDAYEDLFKIFEAQNPDIDVVHTAHRNTEYNTILAAALNGGSGPDVFMARSYGGFEAFAQSGYMQVLDDLMPELKNFNDANRRGCTSVTDGKIYGVPMASQTCVIFYNTAIYRKLGLKIPVTWDEFITNLETIKKAGITPIGFGGKDAWDFETMLGNLAPNFYGANNFYEKARAGQTTFQDPSFVGAIEKLNQLKPYVPDMVLGVSYDDARALFINEQAAHFLGGSYDAAYFTSQNPDLTYDIFMPPVAKAGDTSYISVYADGSYAMNTATPKKDAALKLLKFFAGKDTGEMHVKVIKWVTAVPGIDASSDPFITKILNFQKNNTPHIFVVGFRYGQPTGSAEVQSALQGMYGGQMTPADVAKKVQDGVATWFEPFKK
ncbi:MAG: extracellular solute-binding protein [Spirochaetaceae bacterium]|jgi:raffinose/stachyose/melibiose transport system substrate-binding protein|nr:extracellular solute-binding protein [Spirochaetaceae bacterium]